MEIHNAKWAVVHTLGGQRGALGLLGQHDVANRLAAITPTTILDVTQL